MSTTKTFRPFVAAIALALTLPAAPAAAAAPQLTATASPAPAVTPFAAGARAARGYVYSFRLGAVRPGQVVGASFVAGKVRKPVSVTRVRTALRRQSRLQVRSRLRVARARLAVRVDRTAPDTRLTSGPSGTVATGAASFGFSSTERHSRFSCRIDDRAWESCSSPKAYSGVGEGVHWFSVRATDRAGNVDATPAVRSWTVDLPAAPAPATGQTPAPAPSPTSEILPGGMLFRDSFDGSDALITNGYAFWSSNTLAARSPNWEVEVGSLFRRSNTAWSGVPDGNDTDLTSSTGTGSQMFRMWTKRSDFGDVRVTTKLRNEGFTEGDARWPVKSWDGLKIWLRRGGRTGDFDLYTAEVNRRQGNIMLQKKCANSDVYHILAQTSSNASPPLVGQWEDVGGSVKTNADGTVSLEVIRGGRVVLTAKDTGVGCAPITAPGRVGIRAENMQFSIDDFVVSAAS